MGSEAYYETERGVSEYLLFHYGTAAEILPYPDGPSAALGFPVRCVRGCLDVTALPQPARALDLGCAVGRSSFELARFCQEVLGIDASHRFVEAARRLQTDGQLEYRRTEEGLLAQNATACVPADIDRARVRFQCGDAHQLPDGLGQFDVVLLANLIDRLHDPRRCLRQMPGLLRPGGQLIITSPYTWMSDYTPVENWLGGFERHGQPLCTLEALRGLLTPAFELTGLRELPFLIREHARKYQWSVAQASLWRRFA